MPSIYLSPSTQEYNPYYDGGGSEEYYMNLIADAMVPYLISSGIEFTRNTPDMTAASSIQASNAGDYDAHVALHSNAAPPNLSGQLRGTDVYYYPRSDRSRRLAEITAANLKALYPLPDQVRAVPTTSIGEVARTRAPAILIEFAYHDNPEDAEWIKNNIDALGRNVVLSLCEFFGIPFVEPEPIRTATVEVESGNLNIRSAPSLTAPIIGKAPDGAQLFVLGQYDGWYVVRYNEYEGYVRGDYIVLNY
ncbi:N-acetylmuramoyl-L-alanine amidase [Agathobaculum sp. NTUH-O15-33]|uniref:N-acetylmuramoyl-L-alanine amidase n=1 Tax=Agathobaculum sp. NTUH-O15-33 TaxID=3079302 RepID=UPI002958A1A3|nr:N-acetylmuramoyl-L-alanine amidase [Agathobaculum sp. NTUH-O15-33]WNX83460.1 N-acetylmuramoyl-L-alanine amidase [Agathobaculum sp. NTUH-O15-33]